MKKFSKFVIVLFILSLFTSAAYAHSGRTDSSGGHKDNKNVSGLGYYHYHCGGHPAHLHINGICPYSTNYSSSNVLTYQPSVSKPSSVSETPSQNIVNAIKNAVNVYINGIKISENTLLYNDSTYIPLRVVAQYIPNASLSYSSVTQSANLKINNINYSEETEKANFLDNNIVFIIHPDDDVYHYYDCDIFKNTDSYFVALNKEAALISNYVPCDCNHS